MTECGAPEMFELGNESLAELYVYFVELGRMLCKEHLVDLWEMFASFSHRFLSYR